MYRVVLAMMVILSVGSVTPAIAQTCGPHRVALQILGSGGPFPSSSASTGYVVWLDGRSVILIDTGGGVFLRFGEAGARIDQLELIAISHLHPDHVSDLPALLWLTGFRDSPLRIVGPSGNDQFPGFTAFLTHLFGERDSAFPILSRRNNTNQGGGATLQPTTVDVGKPEPTAIVTGGQLEVTALGVPHTAPTLAYRISTGESSIVFSSDQNGSNPGFIEFARGADILVMHFPISKDATGPITENHATPSVVGNVAARAQVGRLVLSHLGYPRAGASNAAVFSASNPTVLAASVEEVKRHYEGPVTIAEDLQCLVLEN